MSPAHVPDDADRYARHRMRIITVSSAGKITADVLQPWPAVSVTSMASGTDPGFPAAEVPSGVIERSAGGREVLETVDGIRLELDGSGHAIASDETGRLGGPGIFMVVEVLPS